MGKSLLLPDENLIFVLLRLPVYEYLMPLTNGFGIFSFYVPPFAGIFILCL